MQPSSSFAIHYIHWFRKVKSRLLQVYTREGWSSALCALGQGHSPTGLPGPAEIFQPEQLQKKSSILCTEQPCLTADTILLEEHSHPELTWNTLKYVLITARGFLTSQDEKQQWKTQSQCLQPVLFQVSDSVDFKCHREKQQEEGIFALT